MSKLKRAFTLILSCLALQSLMAEHIIGGEINYQCTGPGSYQFTMKMWRDCFSPGANFDNPATIGIFNQNGLLIQQVSAMVTSVVPVSTTLDTPCLSIPPNICVQEGTYVFTVTGLNVNQAHSVVYQRCCRNQTIQNLIAPGSQGLTIMTQVPAFSQVQCNSSPAFSNFPPTVLCAMEPLTFDHSAIDADGDSLAYKLCTPLHGGSQAQPMPVPPANPPYAPIQWLAPFNALNPLNGNPGLAINPITGLLTGTPTQLGQYVVGVCVEEWRDGVLIGTSTRDFQFNVAFCEPTAEAIIQEPSIGDLCVSLTVNFFNLSNPVNSFVWDYGDPNTIFDTSTDYNGIYTYPDTGTYTVSLITNPGFFCSDTAQITITLSYQAEVQIQLTSFECIDGIQHYNLQASGSYNPDISVLQWDFGPSANTPVMEGQTVSGLSFNNTGAQSITLTLANNVCAAVGSLNLNVDPPPQIQITPQSVFCAGLSYNFTQTSTHVNSYLWNFGVPGNDGAVSIQANPNFVFPAAGQYTVTLTGQNANNCPITVEETFDIQPLLSAQIPQLPTICFDGHSINLEAGGSFGNNAQFNWTFSNSVPATSSVQNPQGIIFLEPGNHPVILSISENGCTRSAESNILIHANPRADFEATPLSGCAPLRVSFLNTSFSQSSSVAYEWDYGDGNVSTARAASHTYENPGSYTVALYMENLNGCIDNDTKVKEAFVTVLPTPKASFSTSPERVSVVDPTLTLTDLSIGNSGCTWHFDNNEFTDCNFTHELQHLVPQPITLVVYNEDGCRSSATGMIYLSDHIIFVPNSFTPNGDGVNDIFTPITTAVLSYEMHIVDRWGREVYSENPVQRGWDGSIMGGSYYAEQGMYQYLIRVTDYQGWNFDYSGYVNLIR